MEREENELKLCTILSDEIRRNRSFVFIRRTTSASRTIEYEVCTQCYQHLNMSDTVEANKNKYSWPSFIWNLLQSEDVQELYNASDVWKVIPIQWREWWLESIHQHFPTFYSQMTLTIPKPIINDCTVKMKNWKESIESGNLNKIASICNTHLVPNVLCPWGCSEFLHKVGKIEMQPIFQKRFRKCNIASKLKDSDLSFVEPSRDDYFRNSSDGYDMWLYNPEWKVFPSIAFFNGSPYILSCKDHNGGCKQLQVHCCRWKCNISSALSDQICHAVVKSRTVKHTKVGYNTIGYQMVEQRFSWKGPDSINISSIGKTDHNSILLHQAEARSVANRSDMKGLLKGLVDEGIISNNHADSIEEYSKHCSEETDYSNYKIGATYVPLEVALSMKREGRNRECDVTIDDDENEGVLLPPYTRKFKRIWPLYLYPLQTMDCYGAKMHNFPSFNRVNEGKLCWIAASILLTVEPVWTLVAQMDLRSSECFGYLLVYLTKECVPYLDRRVVGKFKKLNNTELVNKVNQHGNIGELILVQL